MDVSQVPRRAPRSPKLTARSTFLNGLLRSDNFASIASTVPCDIVNELENNAEAAEQFVREIQAGQVPTLIENLPSEVVDAFGAIINVALSLPQSIVDTAESVVDGFEGLFDSIADGSIVSELPEEIADAWEDVTDGFVDAWNDLTADIACLFGDCAEPTPGGCDSSVPVSVYASATPVVYYNSTSAPYTYSYNRALSSAVAAASSAAYAQATASESSLHPVAIGTSIAYVQETYSLTVYASASASASASAQALPNAAPWACESHGMAWMLGGMLAVGGLVVWL